MKGTEARVAREPEEVSVPQAAGRFQPFERRIDLAEPRVDGREGNRRRLTPRAAPFKFPEETQGFVCPAELCAHVPQGGEGQGFARATDSLAGLAREQAEHAHWLRAQPQGPARPGQRSALEIHFELAEGDAGGLQMAAEFVNSTFGAPRANCAIPITLSMKFKQFEDAVMGPYSYVGVVTDDGGSLEIAFMMLGTGPGSHLALDHAKRISTRAR